MTRQIGPPRAPKISLSVDMTNAFPHPPGTELQNKILPRFRAGSLATAGKLHDVDIQSRRRRRRGRRGRCVADSLKSDTVTPSSSSPRLLFVCMLRISQQPCAFLHSLLVRSSKSYITSGASRQTGNLDTTAARIHSHDRGGFRSGVNLESCSAQHRSS